MKYFKFYKVIKRLGILGICIALLIPVKSVYAAALVVTSNADVVAVNGQCTLREAIVNANNDAATNVDCAAGTGVDTITFSAAMTITLGSSLPNITDADLLTINGGSNVIVSGNNLFRIVTVTAAANTAFQNITLQDGAVNGNGGAIVNNGILTVTNVSFTNNRTITNVANDGGAINHAAGTLTVTNSTFTNNFTQDNGGAIHVAGGTVNISGSTFLNNNNILTDDGGAIYQNAGIVTITNSSFTGNGCNEEGGAIFKNGGALTIDGNSVFEGNISVNDGGGLYAVNAGNTTITNSTFRNHTNAGINNGGAVYFATGTLNITGSTFTGNRAPLNLGGAIYFASGTGTISSTSFTGNNSQTNGGAIYKNGGNLTINANSMFDGNYSLTNGGAIYAANAGALTIANSTFQNQNNAGIDSGGALFFNTGTLNITGSTFSANRAQGAGDQGGAIYINSGTAIIAGTSFLNNIADTFGGAVRVNGGTVTINAASTFTGNTATANDGGAIYMATGTVNVSDTIFSNNAAGTDGGAIIVASGTLTLTNDTFSTNRADDGGAIYHNAATLLTITNSTFTGNLANGEADGDGGAITMNSLAAGSSLTITGSTFSNNTANDDGGVLWNNAEPVTITSSTFSTNQARSGNGTAEGGAIYSSVNADATSIRLSTFTNNSVAATANVNAYGGAISNAGTAFVLANDTFSGNSITKTTAGAGNSQGGAVRTSVVAADTTTIHNVTFNGNSATESGTGAADGGSLQRVAGTVTVANTILANSLENAVAGNCGSTITNGGNNIHFNGADCGAAFTNINPNLGVLTGSPSYFPLNPASPAINAGSNAICATAGTTNNQSQNGVARPQEVIFDIGSFEYSNLPPTDIALANNTVDENQSVNTIVGALTATDPDAGATFTFTLACAVAGADDAFFNIAGTDLQTSASFDFETQNIYNICIRVTDQGGLTYDENFVVNVNNLNEAPTDIALSNNTVDENQPANTVVGILSATDPDAGATFTFDLTCAIAGADDGFFNIAGRDLQTSASFDFETQNVYNICIRVTDQGGLTYDENFVVNVNNLNEAPTDIALSNNTVDENQPANTVVGILSATDPDAGATFAFDFTCAIAGADDGFFNIAGTDLQTSASFDYEAQNIYNICIRVTDQSGLTYDENFVINVNNLNEAPTDIALSNNTVDENQPANTVVGILSATDPDAGATFAFDFICAIAGADDGFFNIAGIDLQTSASFDFETQNIYNICIRVTDQGGLTYDENFVVNVNNVNEPPTDIALSNNMIAENNAVNAVIGVLSATDVDGGEIFTFSLTCAVPGANDVSFNINGTDLRASSAFDYETQNSYSICIRVMDSGSNTFDENFIITITDLDEIPPSVTIDQAIGQVDPTNTSPINFTVVFSETVIGFIDTDVSLSGTALPATALVTEIAPNDGTTYNVAVSGMANGGTVIASLNAGVVTDAAGNVSIASTSTDNIVNFDPDYPVVLFNADTTPANASTLTVGPTQITIAYSEDVKNDGSAGAANTIVNYLLVEAGVNLVFDTVSCVVGLAPADTQITIDSAVYTNNGGGGPFVATLNINGGAPLPVGNYQLLICGTTSIEDLVNNELNNGLSDTTLNFIVTALKTLPNTGFPMDEVTAIPHQPEDLKYASYPDLWLEIPKLKLNLAIVGVPLKNGGWDVTWLNKDAGWLNNSAFPTWKGNSVITAHVWDALNKPGPFARLKELKYGDQVKVHAFGQIYIYEIRESKLISASNKTDAFEHKEKSWITLITCENYKELSKTYTYRRMVRAVLISVIHEK